MATHVEPGQRSATLEPRTVRRAVEMYLAMNFKVKPKCNCETATYVIVNADAPGDDGEAQFWHAEGAAGSHGWGPREGATVYEGPAMKQIIDTKMLPKGGAPQGAEGDHTHDPIGVTIAPDGSAHVILDDKSPPFTRPAEGPEPS